MSPIAETIKTIVYAGACCYIVNIVCHTSICALAILVQADITICEYSLKLMGFASHQGGEVIQIGWYIFVNAINSFLGDHKCLAIIATYSLLHQALKYPEDLRSLLAMLGSGLDWMHQKALPAVYTTFRRIRDFILSDLLYTDFFSFMIHITIVVLCISVFVYAWTDVVASLNAM